MSDNAEYERQLKFEYRDGWIGGFLYGLVIGVIGVTPLILALSR